MSGLDLDSLEKLLAEAKPAAPWREHKYGIIADGGDVVSWDYAWGENEHTEEWTLKPLIVAAVNALPALITRLRAAEARAAWQPIETAPIDGVDRLVCTEGGSYYIACLYAEDGWLTDDDGPERQVYPTHWQSLPTAPEAP